LNSFYFFLSFLFSRSRSYQDPRVQLSRFAQKQFAQVGFEPLKDYGALQDVISGTHHELTNM
jgi:hypothetical protein